MHKISPLEFLKLSLAMPYLDAGELSNIIKPESLPDWKAVQKEATDAADAITPDNSTIQAHARLMEIAEFAERQAQ